MIAEFGHLALILAFILSLAQIALPMIGAHKGYADWMEAGRSLAITQFLFTALSFAALIWAFVISDFSLRIVAANSHSLKPMIYKVSGAWGNHEGSLLLWVTSLTLFGALVAAFGRDLPASLRARVLGVQAMIGAAFFAFILFTSNPFERLDPAPLDGGDLNPLLQDLGLAFHPPFLYLGYVGLSIAFSFAVAALIEGKVDGAWARWVRPWTLAAWIFLTIGIAMGSYWAYYELGWGGWWFWDPVENASFMPWLIGGALLHSAIVVEKRNTLKSWTILLAILAFSFSLIGTFIVRSGVLTSVHAFANDPERGVYILFMLVAAIGGSLTLFAARASELEAGGLFKPVSREGALVLNNLLLTVAATAIFVGTIAPLIREWLTGEAISVGRFFFDLTFGFFMALLMLALPVGAMLPWKRGDLGAVFSRLWVAGVAALFAALAAIILYEAPEGEAALGTARMWIARIAPPLGLGLAAWAVVGALAGLAERIKLFKAPAAESARRLGALPRAFWGMSLAHIGVGLMAFGAVAVTTWEIEDIRIAQPGETFPLGGYELRFDGVSEVQGPNYISRQGAFALLRNGEEMRIMRPEKRFYPVQKITTTEAAIRPSLINDIYVTLGEKQPDEAGGGWGVRSHIKPFANWIWIGALFMAMGGLLSLLDRRLRVGAPAPRGARKAARA